ncbi:MAG TPA: Bax inhibitor-1/YccA family protein [Mycobacteriales bacterium]|nr:Bax inhibitor-1/YccA family protein [Mycobacteriales bacterium]
MQSNNPVLGRGFGQGQQHASWNTAPAPSAGDLQDMYNRPAYTPQARFMTLDDVVLRTAATLGMVVVVGAIAWIFKLDSLALVGALVGFVLALVISFKQSTNPALILSYAAAEGLFLGGISRVFNNAYGGGIVIQAVVGTAGVFAGMLVVYKTGAIRVTPKFTRWLLGALIGVVALSLVNLVASLFTPGGLGLRSAENPALAIGFSLLCIGIAAFTFLLDFDMIDKGIRQGAPERFAWYAAFGLTVTLVWLYLEILRLLSYFRD